MADIKKEVEVAKTKTVKKRTPKKPKLERFKHTLIQDVPITDKDGYKVLKKGTTVELTRDGVKHYKQNSYIK